VRPQLEHASSLFDNTKKQKSKLYSEAQPISPARLQMYNHSISVTTVLQKLQWDSLHQRRACSRVLMPYHIRNGLVAIPALVCLQPTVVHTRGFETSYCTSFRCFTVYKC